MKFCQRCKLEVFGGSICHICASGLIDKQDAGDEKQTKKISSKILGGKKRLRGDLTQSLPARLLRILLEIAIFCAIFVGVTSGFMITSNWLADQMESTLPRFPITDYNPEGTFVANKILYFWYVCAAIVGALTFKYRFKPYK